MAAQVDGRIKLYVTYQVLHCRRNHPGLFSEGEYIPLELSGHRAEHLFAFSRRAGPDTTIVAVPRLLTKLIPGTDQMPVGVKTWKDTHLCLPGSFSRSCWRNVFTGETVIAKQDGEIPCLSAADLMNHFPVALLMLQ